MSRQGRPKSCLNGLFVQALIIFSDHGFVENPAFIPTDKYETLRYVHGKDSPLRGHSSLGLDYAAVRELMPTARPKDH